MADKKLNIGKHLGSDWLKRLAPKTLPMPVSSGAKAPAAPLAPKAPPMPGFPRAVDPGFSKLAPDAPAGGPRLPSFGPIGTNPPGPKAGAIVAPGATIDPGFSKLKPGPAKLPGMPIGIGAPPPEPAAPTPGADQAAAEAALKPGMGGVAAIGDGKGGKGKSSSMIPKFFDVGLPDLAAAPPQAPMPGALPGLPIDATADAAARVAAAPAVDPAKQSAEATISAKAPAVPVAAVPGQLPAALPVDVSTERQALPEASATAQFLPGRPVAIAPFDPAKEPGWQALYKTNNPALAAERKAAGWTAINQTWDEATKTFVAAAPASTTAAPAPAAPTNPVLPNVTPVAPETYEQIKARADAANAANPDAAAPVVPGAEPPAAATPGAEEAEAKDDLDTFLLDWYKTAATMTEDPASKIAFNQAIVQMGMLNQSQQQSLQAKINADPKLAGTPAGTATLMMAARDANIDMDTMIGNLSEKALANVREMNKLGIAGVAALNQIRKTETDRDIENLSEAIKRKAGAGDVEGAKALYEQMVNKDPDRFDGIDFDAFLSAGEISTLQNTARQSALSDARNSFAQGDLGDTISSLESAYNEQERNTRGQKVIENNDIATLNKMLEAADMDPITDKAELIGREGDIFVAEQISKMDKEYNSTWLDKQTDSMLHDLGVDGTDPDIERATRAWLLDLKTTGGLTVDAEGKVTFNPNTLVPPWDPKSTSAHLFMHWPVMDDDGNVVGGFSNPYDEDDPRPTPDGSPEQYQYMESMDKAWETYVLNTPTKDRLTREQWFYATKGGENKDESGKVVIPEDYTPPPGLGDGGDDDDVDEIDAEEFANAIKSAPNFGTIDGKPIDWTSAVAKDYINSIPKTPPASIGNAETWANKNLGEVVNFGGKLYYVNSGKGYVHHHKGNSDRYQDAMELTDMNGNTVWMNSEGKINTNPPVKDGGGKGQYYKEWFAAFK